MSIQRLRTNKKGFTILELMLATVVVSVMLILVTMVLIGMESLFNKGINEQKTQDTVRTVVDQVTQEIQSSAGGVRSITTAVYPLHSVKQKKADNTFTTNNFTVYAYCIGSVRYLYVIGLQVGTATKQGLWRDQAPEGSDCITQPIPDNSLDIIVNDPSAVETGTEMISPGERLTDFEIIPPANPNINQDFTVKVSVAYGNDPVLSQYPYTYNTHCLGIVSGDQYCATSSLTSEVAQRDNTTAPSL